MLIWKTYFLINLQKDFLIQWCVHIICNTIHKKGCITVKYIIPSVRIVPGNHCCFSSLRNIMLHHNVRISEADIYFLCDGLNVRYRSGFDFTWDSYNRETQLNFAQNCGLDVHECFNIDKETSCFDMYDLVCKQHIIMLFTDSQYLDYHAVYRENPGRGHIIILYGMDIDNQTAYVGDSFLLDAGGNILIYQGPASYERLCRGISSWTWFDFIENKPISKENIVLEAIKNIESFSKGNITVQKELCGILAYRKYFEHFEHLAQVEDAKFKEVCSEIYYSLRIGTIMNLIEYMGQFVLETADFYQKDSSRIADEISNLHLGWKRNMFNVYKMGVRKNKNSVGSIISKSQSLIDLLETVLEDVLTFLRLCVDS